MSDVKNQIKFFQEKSTIRGAVILKEILEEHTPRKKSGNFSITQNGN